MRGNERRKKILDILSAGTAPVPGSKLAEMLNVSRQIIVQDMALLRAEQHNIVSTNSGYVLLTNERPTRVFKVRHTDEEAETEMNIVVDNGGELVDVFVFHKSYGVIRADMNFTSRRDVKAFLRDIASGKSSLLMKVTDGYHYHTVAAEDESVLDIIQEQLEEKGFLAPLQEYEPINFWKDAADE
ncbi:MAG: transcription repressor NadR [Clostridiales bacterium]|nr:transcription repressor NadR [Candidatus Crickella merdequi]